MSDFKNLDRLFKEKFTNFEVAVPHNSWRNVSKKIHSSQSSINTISKTKYYIATYFIVTSALMALYGDYIYSTNVTLETSSDKPIQTNRKGNYELVNTKHFKGEYLAYKNLLQQQIAAKNYLNIAAAKISLPDTVIDTSQNTIITTNQTTVLKANIFRMGQNNEILKVKVPLLSQAEIDNYLNTISDSLNTITEETLLPIKKELVRNK